MDYGICNKKLLNNIMYFSVGDPSHLSDHATLTLCVRANSHAQVNKSQIQVDGTNPNNISMKKIPMGFKWSPESVKAYKDAFNLPLIHQRLNIINEYCSKSNEQDPNKLCKLVTDLFIQAASLSLKRKKLPRTVQNKTARWYDNDLFSLKNKILQHRRLVQKCPSNRFIYQQFFLLKKQYRNCCRSAKRNYFNSLSQNIEDLCLKNDKKFWSVLKSVQSVNEDYLPDSHCLYNYFEQLHSVQESDNSLYSENVQNIVAKQLECLEPYLYEHNNHITTLEVSNAIKNLKGNKAHYQDLISNEMLK